MTTCTWIQSSMQWLPLIIAMVTKGLIISQVDEPNTFEDQGIDGDPGKNYKKIRAQMVHAVKHDGCHKAHPVAGGSST